MADAPKWVEKEKFQLLPEATSEKGGGGPSQTEDAETKLPEPPPLPEIPDRKLTRRKEVVLNKLEADAYFGPKDQAQKRGRKRQVEKTAQALGLPPSGHTKRVSGMIQRSPFQQRDATGKRK